MQRCEVIEGPKNAASSSAPSELVLAGQSAIITGANRGLGSVIAEHFIRAGANVVLTARDMDLLTTVGRDLRAQRVLADQQVETLRADVSNPDDCAATFDLAKSLPRLAILVNNAGIYGPIGRLEETPWDEWLKAIEVNLFGTVHMCRAVIPHLRTQRYGKIINLSGGGASAPLPRFTSYAASKAAVVRLTETLMEELRDDHIDVNAVAPGALNTRLLDQVIVSGPEKAGQAFYNKALKQQAEGGSPLHVAASLCVFLASAASDGISGRLISAVWDDWQKLPERREALQGDIYTLRRIVPTDRGLSW
jgi:3-oxoacyl-[acyl-carrier protein] reductase